MGAWGTAIFSNDTSSDVRDEFKKYLQDGLSDLDASERIVTDFCSLDDSDLENNDVWLGLAATQHATGHVIPEVIDRALSVIHSMNDLDRWDQSDRRARTAALVKLEVQLRSAPPPPKVFKPRRKQMTKLIPGNHLVYTEGDSKILLRVVNIDEDESGTAPIFTVLDWDGSETALETAASIPPLPRHRHDRPYFKFCPVGRQPRKENLVLLNAVGPASTPGVGNWGISILPWKNMMKVIKQGASVAPATIKNLVV